MEFLGQGYPRFEGLLFHTAKLLSSKVKWIYTPTCCCPYSNQSFCNLKKKKIKNERKTLSQTALFRKIIYIEKNIWWPAYSLIYYYKISGKKILGGLKHNYELLLDWCDGFTFDPKNINPQIAFPLPVTPCPSDSSYSFWFQFSKGSWEEVASTDTAEGNMLDGEKKGLMFPAVSKKFL